MLLSLILLYAATDFFVASDLIQETSANILAEQRVKTNQGALGFYASVNNYPSSVNKTYYEKDENPVRVPNKFYEERKMKSKVTKSPKRTIQKIIKKGKSRSRKIYAHPVTRQPMKTSPNDEVVNSYTQRNVKASVSTEHNHKKKPRKNTKIIRYPMPFHSFQSKKGIPHKRNKRDLSREDIVIIKDLDEMEFQTQNKDYDIVKAHVQKHW